MKKLKPLLVTVLLFLIVISEVSAEDRIDALLDNTVDDFSSALYSAGKNPVVSIWNFTYADKNMGSSFSRYIEDKLSVAINGNHRFTLFARDRLDEIMKTVELNLNDVFDQDTTVTVGKLKGINYIITGKFFDTGSGVNLFLELIDLESGTVVKKKELVIPKSEIPASVSIRPDNYNDALYVLEQLREVQNSGKGAFTVKAWINRGDGGTYRDGENLIINFYSNRDCYVKIYHIDVNKKVKLIFPNKYYKGNFIEAKKIYRIPDSSYPFNFKLTYPYGTEFIKVVASTLQFSDIESSFKDLGTASKKIVSRGLNVKAKNNQITESLISYTIIK